MKPVVLIFPVAIAVMLGAAAPAGARCPAPPVAAGPDASLPCVVLNPIPEADQRVYFGAASAALTDAAKAVLDRQAEVLRKNPDLRIEVVGVAEPVEAPAGADKAALGVRRAGAVREYLVGRGIPSGRIAAEGRDYAPMIPREADERALAAMRYARTQAGYP